RLKIFKAAPSALNRPGHNLVTADRKKFLRRQRKDLKISRVKERGKGRRVFQSQAPELGNGVDFFLANDLELLRQIRLVTIPRPQIIKDPPDRPDILIPSKVRAC